MTNRFMGEESKKQQIKEEARLHKMGKSGIMRLSKWLYNRVFAIIVIIKVRGNLLLSNFYLYVGTKQSSDFVNATPKISVAVSLIISNKNLNKSGVMRLQIYITLASVSL
ncbi:MAG: hypothetical protein LBT35_00120 [Tannerella sp.]|jgi:hypothetical protein|nr:hypothetical protein [Tannerella sp.]